MVFPWLFTANFLLFLKVLLLEHEEKMNEKSQELNWGIVFANFPEFLLRIWTTLHKMQQYFGLTLTPCHSNEPGIKFFIFKCLIKTFVVSQKWVWRIPREILILTPKSVNSANGQGYILKKKNLFKKINSQIRWFYMTISPS